MNSQWDIDVDKLLSFCTSGRKIIKKKELREREKFLENFEKIIKTYSTDSSGTCRRTIGYFNSEQQFK